MHLLRSMTRLRWCVLAWFALCYGVALATPLVKPHALALVCSSSGMALVSHADGSHPPLAKPGLDCPLCLLGSAPPSQPSARLPLQPAVPESVAMPPGLLALAPSGAPPPARAPPFPLCQSERG